jgi:hypothetical protein
VSRSTSDHLNGDTRAGFVVSFETADGLVTLHRRGRVKLTMLEEACDDVLARWPEAKLVCYSTPRTILADLRGRNERRGGYAERHVLGQLKRLELLHELIA